MTSRTTDGLELGNGAPASLDDETIARFTSSAALPHHARVGIPSELALQLDAHFIGCTTARLAQIRRQHEQQVVAAAEELLTDATLRRDLSRLPLALGARVTVTGDSVTADSLSWARLLAAVLRRARPDVSVLNIAVSGITSGELLSMSDLILRSRPDWVLQMIGTNDARRHGRATEVTAVSSTETERNLAAITGIVRDDARARLIALTPPPIDQPRFERFRDATSDIHWLASEVETVARLASTSGSDAVIDLYGELFTDTPSSFWTDDGVHPSFEGHQTILRLVVEGLVAAGQSSPRDT